MTDSFGCPAGTDFRTTDGLVLVTRCKRKAGHAGKHTDCRTKRWADEQTTWLLSPPSAPRLDDLRALLANEASLAAATEAVRQEAVRSAALEAEVSA